MTTDRQKAAVRFCEERLIDCKFKGDINNFQQVSSFLRKNLYAAKFSPDYISEYEAYRGVGNSIYVVTRMANDTYSMPIIVNRNYICKEEFSLKSLKNKKKYFERCIRLKDNKYKAKNTLLVDKEEMFRKALDEDTPLLLEFSTYDDVYGLSLNVLKKNT